VALVCAQGKELCKISYEAERDVTSVMDDD
jgi:hypothetical protein